MLSQAYDMKYGLYNYNRKDAHPLAPVLLHPAEDLGFESLKRRLLKRYRAASVYKHTGIPFDRFKQLPRVEVEDILTECIEADQKEFNTAAAMQRDMEALSGQVKKN